MKKFSDTIIKEAVRKYWEATHPQDVVVFFLQKYDFEEEWEQCEELVICDSWADPDAFTIINDFCEGQTDVKEINIIPLCDVVTYYRNNKLEVNNG